MYQFSANVSCLDTHQASCKTLVDFPLQVTRVPMFYIIGTCVSKVT
jgi:hypothetical protein